MKTTVHLPIDKNIKLSVKVGDRIEKGSNIGEVVLQKEESVVPIAQLLGIKPSLLLKYLKKKIGEKVFPGEVLARRRNFLSSSFVKCPTAGRIKEIDLKKGTLTILQSLSRKNLSKTEEVTLPVSGKIKSITRNFIELEIEGEVLRAKKGSGRETAGTIFYLQGDSVGVLDISAEAKGRVVVCRRLSSDAVVKLEVLGAYGLVVQSQVGETDLTWMQVTEAVFKKLSSSREKTAWLRPNEKEIVILG